MIPEKPFAGLLQLGERWNVAVAEYETEPVAQFLIVVREREFSLYRAPREHSRSVETLPGAVAPAGSEPEAST